MIIQSRRRFLGALASVAAAPAVASVASLIPAAAIEAAPEFGTGPALAAMNAQRIYNFRRSATLDYMRANLFSPYKAPA